MSLIQKLRFERGFVGDEEVSHAALWEKSTTGSASVCSGTERRLRGWSGRGTCGQMWNLPDFLRTLALSVVQSGELLQGFAWRMMFRLSV